MTPLDVVRVQAGAHEGKAGVVLRVEKNRLGEVHTAHVRLDEDRSKSVAFAPADLRVLKPHGA